MSEETNKDTFTIALSEVFEKLKETVMQVGHEGYELGYKMGLLTGVVRTISVQVIIMSLVYMYWVLR